MVVIFSSDSLPDEARRLLGKWSLAEGKTDAIPEAEVLMVWRIDEDMLSSAKKLRAIQTFSAGVDHLPFKLIPPGVKVFSNAGAYSRPVAEHAWALILHLAKGINIRDNAIASDYPRQLFGKRLLVLGAGGIGQETAKLGKAFGMFTVGISRHPAPREGFDLVAGLDELNHELALADVVVVALPLNKYSVGLLNSSRIALLKDTCILVNVGRGAVVDQEAIFDALKERRTLRFGTDVWWDEGGREGSHLPFYDLPNFAGTPHIAGGAGKETANVAKIAAARNVATFLETGRANNEVNFADYLRNRATPCYKSGRPNIAHENRL